MNRFIGQPRLTVLGSNGKQNDVALTKLDMNPSGGIMPLGKLVIL